MVGTYDVMAILYDALSGHAPSPEQWCCDFCNANNPRPDLQLEIPPHLRESLVEAETQSSGELVIRMTRDDACCVMMCSSRFDPGPAR